MRTASSIALLSGLLVLTACFAPTGSDRPDDPSPPSANSDTQQGALPPAQAARAALAARLDVDMNSIVVLSAEEREWSDGCLGLGGPAESCLAAITSGYLVILEHDGVEYRYRTDVSGEAVRAEE